MRYNVAQLLKGPTGARRRYEFEEEIRDLDPELDPLAPLVGWVSLMRSSQGILVTGLLRTRIQTTCLRCLEPVDIEIELDLEEEFYPAVRINDVHLDDVAEEEQDAALLIDDHHILDLREVIRQGLWLAVPMEAICSPDCAGLCPQCGGNRNLGECQCVETSLDPRWAVLQGLLTIDQDSQERSD
jgi:uncharacterized protein